MKETKRENIEVKEQIEELILCLPPDVHLRPISEQIALAKALEKAELILVKIKDEIKRTVEKLPYAFSLKLLIEKNKNNEVKVEVINEAPKAQSSPRTRRRTGKIKLIIEGKENIVGSYADALRKVKELYPDFDYSERDSAVRVYERWKNWLSDRGIVILEE
uniref:Uncharacterized protein n=1 Tax=candidate division WOR-3 bacterium TaxID=2052148 RepID=A0A7V4E378_UNCW3